MFSGVILCCAALPKSKSLDAVTVAEPRSKGNVEPLVRLAARDMATVDALILDRMQSQVPVIPLLAEHLISAGGKRLRPLLTLAAARASGASGDITAPVKLAAAVEFIHTATLLHDDVVDASDLRRGKVAAHLIWGAPSSVLVGDFLFARAFELMVETGQMRALGILARASSVISEGEVLQLTRAHDLNLDQDTYLQIISAKTAELFAAAAEAGAVGAGADETAVEALRAYGLNLGLAFQLADAALDYGRTAPAPGTNTRHHLPQGQVPNPPTVATGRAPGGNRAGAAVVWGVSIGGRGCFGNAAAGSARHNDLCRGRDRISEPSRRRTQALQHDHHAGIGMRCGLGS